MKIGIIGGGPAGLSAALSLARVNRQCIVFDSQQYRNSMAKDVHNVLSRDGETNQSFRSISRKQIESYKSVHFINERVINIQHEQHKPGFTLTTANGQSELVSNILFAAGIVDVVDHIDGLSDLWLAGKANHCIFCHGFEQKGSSLGVLANGQIATKLLSMASTLHNSITVLTNGPLIDLDGTLRLKYFAPSTRSFAQLNESKIQSFSLLNLTTSNTTNGTQVQVKFQDGSTKNFGSVMLSPNSVIASQTKTLLEMTNVPVETISSSPESQHELVRPKDAFGRTYQPNVYVAGDMATLHRSIPFSMASGAWAASAIHEDIAIKDFTVQ